MPASAINDDLIIVKKNLKSIVLADPDWTPSDLDADLGDDGASFEIESDDGSGLGSFEPSGSESSKSTLERCVRRHRFHHGRRYHHYRPGTYPLPNDQLEQDREDMKHIMMVDLADGKHFLARSGSRKASLTWAPGLGSVGETFPDAKAIGIDLSPIQPRWTPPNVQFCVNDIEDEWLHGTRFDLFHARHVFPFIKDTHRVTQKAFCMYKKSLAHAEIRAHKLYRSLVSGGWLEVQDLGLAALCNNGKVPNDFGIAKFLDITTEAWASLGYEIRIGPKLESLLRATGFINFKCTAYKVPIGR